MDREYLRADQERISQLQIKALEKIPQIPADCLPTQQYLQKFVLPYIRPAMKAVAQKRPKNPVQFFSYYLLAIKNNPQK